MNELYKKYRPKSFKTVVGQNHTLKSLEKMVETKKVPHALLFTGPSGCGKTTLARIVANELGCGKHDTYEVNCADFRGIDMVRDIRNNMKQAPLNGECRVWIIDEAHKLTGDSQNAFLKILEDTPRHVYFMLATTDPQKLLKTVRTRCTEIAVKSLTDADVRVLVERVAKKENITLSDAVVKSIIRNSEGSARKALVFLHQIADLEDEDQQINSIESATLEKQSHHIARALMNPRAKWPEIAKILKESDIEDPEQARWMILGYAKSVLLNGGNLSNRAFIIIDMFKDPFYDSKAAGLAYACYAVINGQG